MFRTLYRRGLVMLLTVGVMGLVANEAHAQGPNTGNISLTSGVDILPGSTYIFRGIVQEGDPKLTLWPYGDVGLALYEGDGGLKSFGVNFGVWNSLHTGSSGTNEEGQGLHYEEDFYAGFSLGFAADTSLGVTYTAYTSPNALFGTTHEIAFKVSAGTLVAPYITIAQELSGGADAGAGEGTYVELGIGPSWDLGGGGVSVSVPVKIGLSAKDYYESPIDGRDNKFGFFDIGISFSVPLGGIPEGFGAWNFHAGVDFFAFGDTTKAFNGGDGGKVTGLFGFGLSY
jgi:hypothetical protein